jgi:hypothetical protein
VSMQNPSKDTAGCNALAAASEKPSTSRPRCTSLRISERARLRELACT